ncbi:MAG TPA: hypothetical protein VJU82_18900 [Acidobacteriaceae bacterium]|nr:hypothetical protein [Acidobacteriaceae bacterium]
MLSVYSKRVIAGAALAGLVAAAGCRVDTGKRGDGKNVDISTPFGGLHVRTNDAEALENIGLAPYPGAVPVQKHNNGKDSSADVDMHFGSFQLRVKAATFHTDDPMDKVEAFYRNDLKRFGDVIACRGNKPDGEPTRTMAGLTCEDTNHRHISVGDSDDHNEFHLKAGSPSHQHIVGLKPDNGGTQFALVVLDLPSGSKDD